MKLLYKLLRLVLAITIVLITSASVFAVTFTVTNLNDVGAGSLRQAIIDANAAGAGPHTINFAVSGIINIGSPLPAVVNAGITIDGGGNITVNAGGGNINRDIFTINASNTTVKGFTVQNTGTQCFQVAGGLSNVTIQDIIANHNSNFIDNVVLVTGASTNMTIKNVMCVAGMEDCGGLDIGRAFYFVNGTQTNLSLEDITVNAICEGIVFRDVSVNGLNIINTTIYGSYNHIVFDNTGGPVETANNVIIDGENTASLYSQRDGGGAAMIYSDFVNTNWQIKNLILDGDRANLVNDADYAIRFDNTTNGITLDGLLVKDFDIYSIWFNSAATNITINNTNVTTPTSGDGGTMQGIRFESTVTTLNMNNVLIDMDINGTTNDADYGLVFGFGVTKLGININNLTVNEADVDGVYVDGVVTNFTMTASTFTNNFDGIEFYNGYNRSNINITNSAFTGHTRSGILINTVSATNSGTISGNNISNNGSNGLWFYGGDGNKNYTVSNNTISFNGSAGVYVNAGPDRINITQNSIFRNRGNGIELDGGGNLGYEGANRPTLTGSTDLGGGMWQVNVSLPTICNATGGCTVEIFANNTSDDVEGRYFVQSFTGLAGGSHTLTIASCTAIPCTGIPYGFWTATLKVVNTGSVSEFSNKQSMKTQGPAAVNSGVALWLDAQDALSGNLPSGTGWQDRSGNDRDFDLVFGTPNRGVSGLNYNHYVQFNGSSYLRSSKSPFVTSFTAGEVIVVTRAYYRHLNQGNPYDLGGSSRSFHYSWGDEAVYNGFGTNDRLGWRPATQAILDGKTGISSITGTRLDIREWNIFQTYSAAGAWGTGFNGQFVATTTTNTPSFALVGGNEHIGAVSGFIFYGDIAEVIMYNRTLTTTERQKINSYLALKYGTSLDQITTNQDYFASDWNGVTGTRMWQNDDDGYEWNIFGIGRDNDSGLHQKQSESTEQNAILSVAIGSSVAASNEANTTSITNDKSFLTFADNNLLQRFGPAVSAANSNFRMHRVWKVDKVNWADGNVTFHFGEDFGGNYLLISSNATFTGITSELQLNANGAVTFNSSLLAHGSYFTVGAKMQLPGCITPPVVSYPNYQEYYNNGAFPYNNPVGYGYNTNLTGTQDVDKKITHSGYYARNFNNSYNCDNCSNIYRARLNIVNPGTYTFYVTSDDNGDVYVDGDLVASVYTCCYTASGTKTLTAGVHDIEVRQSEGGGGDYVTVEYQGPSVSRQQIPVTALVAYTAPGVQTWLKADQGVVTSGGVTRWNDVSGNNNDAYQVNPTFNPTYNSGNAINFNPAVTTSGTQGMLFKKTIPPTNNVHLFAVGRVQTHANWHTLIRGANTDHPIIANGADQFGYYDNNNIGFKGSGQTLSTTEPRLMTMSHSAAGNSAQPRLNGKNGTLLTNINEDDIDYLQHFMNLYWQSGDQSFGTVSEFVAISGTLSATDIQKIESYLALKYGITLDQTTATNYLASSGTMWVNDGDAYKHDIAGIGKDDCQGLHQKQSKSVNGDDPIAIAIGDTIMPTNAANTTNVVNDLSFLVWANNDGNTTNFNIAVTAPGVQSTARIARIWKVDKTNWNNTPNLTINFQGANAQYYLLISNDPTFSTGVTEYQLNSAGNRTFPASALAHNAYFTFAKRIAGPNCVNPGILAWLRGDNGVSGSIWNDFSGNEKNATVTTGTAGAGFMNFNEAVDFNASTYYTLPINMSPNPTTGYPNLTVFMVYNADVGSRTMYGNDDGAADDRSMYMHLNCPGCTAITGLNVTGQSKIATTIWQQGVTNGTFVFADGKQIHNSTKSANVSGPATTWLGRGFSGIGAGSMFDGRVGEFIMYSGPLSTADRNKVESYLALKYGITLDQTSPTNYVASDGTVYWNASSHIGYTNDIAGIGRDDCTNLNQKQSKSVNSDDVITIAVGNTLAASNAANIATITNDKSFFVWSNNDGATTFSPTVSGFPNATVRMSRIWKVDKHNWGDQNITVCASQTGERYLLLSADATFGAGDTEKSFNFSTGCVTFNSNEMPDGSYFTIATKIVGPACVNSGIVAWLRADYGASASSWSDFSGNNNNFSQTLAIEQPVLIEGNTQTNFNPAFNFTVGKNFERTGLLTNAGGTVIAAVSNSNLLSTWADIYNQNIDDPTFGKFAGVANIKMWDNGVYTSTTPQQYILNQNHIAGFDYANAANSYTTYLDGISHNITHAAVPSIEAGIGYIGGENTVETWLGNIYEVIFYNRELTATELQRVNSYLSLKYGVTYNNGSSDYIASDGTTIMWNATVNSGYKNNIAGIGRDDCTDLYQKQSKSVNAGEILTGAIGNSVAATNAANTGTITTDNSYLVWGNNNGLNEFTTQVSGTNITGVLGRVWRVDKTNWTDQNITMCFDGYKDDTYLVISNTSSTFATINHEKQLSALGCVTFNSADLPDGAYFSLGKNIMAPGCVIGGIVTWLDAQTVAAGDMIDGVGWADKSGNNKYFNTVFSDPARSSSLLNYNYFINFDGNDYLRSTQSPFVNSFTAAEVLVVTKSNGQFVGQGNPYDFGSGSREQHLSWGDSHLYNGFGTNDRLGYNPENNTIIDGKTGVGSITGTFYNETNWNLYHTYSATNDWGTGFNGLFKATTTTNTVSFNLTTANEIIGSSGTFVYNGEVAEVVLYRRKLTTIERQKVMSYLALKYGLTLDMTVTDQDYIASDGSTMWDWSDNLGYRNDVAGIGREDCQKLHQKQSKSINGDDPLAIAIGNHSTFPVSNEANSASLADDKSFLVWGNNDGALTFTTTVPKTGINATFRTPRAWKIDKNGFSNQMLTISVGQTGERYLLVDEDGSGGFENDANTKEYAFNFTTGLLNINSSNLPDGAVITLATKISGPACVDSGINVWLRADYGGTPAQWTDYSGNSRNATQNIVANQPTFNPSATNFNPAMVFNGSKNYDFVTGLTSTSASTFIFVSRTNTISSSYQALAELGNDRPGLYWRSGRANNYTFDVTNFDMLHPTTFTAADPAIFTYTLNNANPQNFTIGANALQSSFSGADGTFPLGTGASGAKLGAINFGSGINFDGNMNEVVVYNRVLTNVERQQVESYLALKYGITLTINNDGDGTPFEVISGSVKEGDYVASNGATIYWNAQSNTGYNQNVAGIGLDICTELVQKQSKSVNTGEILTGALGTTVATSNAANTSAFVDSDLSFLVWGHNGGVNDFNNTVGATGINSKAYLGRVWRVQKTNFSNQNITLCFDGYDADEYLLISSSPTFATVTHEKVLNANGCVTFMSNDLADGTYFTLGKSLTGPACVHGGIKMWLRADDGSATGAAWDDVSGNNVNATQTTLANQPAINTSAFNFNPAFDFNGTSHHMLVSAATFPTGTTSRTAFVVASTDKTGWGGAFSYGGATATANVTFSLTQTAGNGYTSAHNGLANDAGPVAGYIINGPPIIQRGGYNGTQLNAQINGSAITVKTFAINTGNTQGYIGTTRFSPTGEYWDGRISEVIIYNKELTATEVQKVNSYLALKYGITLDQTTPTDYIASDGTFMWKASDNTGYGRNIAGIGKDLCTGLHQKQSKSVNSGALITVALGASVAATNDANPNTVTNDKSFLVWSHNNLATTFTTAFSKTGSPINLRMPRIWKVDKTNWADQDITICVGQTGERSLIIDNGGDGNFANDAETSVHTIDIATGCITINSSLLPDGAHFSLGTVIKGPACVNTGVKVWYRADYGATVSAWADYSGNSVSATQTTTANQPALTGAINFNPAYTFDGIDDHFLTNLDAIKGGNYALFAVGVREDANINYAIGSNGATANQNLHFGYRNNTTATLDQWINAVDVTVNAFNNPTQTPYLLFGEFFGTGHSIEENRNSTRVSNANTNTVALSGTAQEYIGRLNAEYYSGRIAEVVAYNTALGAAEEQRIKSYLALKYGITLDQTTPTNYVASNGSTIMWNAIDNSIYRHNIAGLGRDTCTALHQKQSRSVNAGEFLTVALGTSIAASNNANTNTITNDLSFLTWGHNNGSTDFLSDAGGTNATVRMNRVWRVDKTNWVDQNIRMKFTGYNNSHYLIIHNTDPTFTSMPLEYALDANGEVTLNTSDLPDGAYFTLGKNLKGPACVDGGIKMWLRADDFAGGTDGMDVTNWLDISGNNYNVSQSIVTAKPKYYNTTVANLLNFNPAVSFDGTDELNNLTRLYQNTDGFNLIAVAKDTRTILSQLRGPMGVGVDGNYPAMDLQTDITSPNGWNPLMTGSTPVEWNGGGALLYNGNTGGPNQQPQIFSLSSANGGTDNIISWVDGFKQTTTLDANNQTEIGNGIWVGSSGDAEWLGSIAEIIVYNKLLTDAEVQRINSYLALKYGITLRQTPTATNYLASDGSNMWVNDSDGFIHDIAGIGKDDCTSLHQKQSRSVNGDDIVTLAVGSHTAIPTTNAANTSTVINDLSFFSWANNNGNTDVFSTAVTATHATLRMARVWKVDKFNWQDQNVTICFTGQIGERYLLIDDDSPTMASVNKEIALDPLTGCATFNSSELVHGYYFSLGTKILGPGCVNNNNILTWLRADYGATSSQWNDFSGRSTHARQTTLANQPANTGLMNFNPAMDFDGGDFLNFDITGQNLDINYTVAGRNPITVLSVYNADVTGRPIWGNDDGGEDRYLRMPDVANGGGATSYTGGNVASQSKIVTTIMHEGVGGGSFVYADGRQQLNFTQSGSGGGLTYTMLGRDWTGRTAGAMFDGRISEFAVYSGALSPAQLRQAESYLAIKYGLTLSNDNNGNSTPLEVVSGSLNEGDYIASDGTTKIWDALANAGYHNDIASIGRDTCTILNQKQSRSANSDDIVTIALGSHITIPATNSANTSTFTNDLAFLAWGNNDGLKAFNTALTGTYVNSRLGRIWKVQRSINWDDAQNITLCFTGFSDKDYLLISSSSSFSTLTLEQQLDANGCTTINSALLPNGYYFTLGTSISGPACVNIGTTIWLRADKDAAGANWNDQSGNDVNATQSTSGNQPNISPAAINFNPALVFDGSDDFMSISPLSGLPYGATPRTIISVGYSSNTAGNRWIFSYGSAINSQANFWGQQGTTGNYGGFLNDVTSTGYWTTNIPNLTVNTYNGTNATIAKDGKLLVSTAKTWNTVLNKGYIGRQVNDLEYWQGGIGEVVVYDRLLTPLELQQVHSYLALKYGLTLTTDNNNNSTNFETLSGSVTEGDYVASNGTTIYWDASTNAGYNNNIAGIGVDSCTNLIQKQSKSSNVSTNTRLTVALGTIAVSNAANTSAFSADKQFLVWGDDNATFAETMTDLPTAFAANTKRFTREWKVQRTGTVGTVQMLFDLSSLTISATSISELKLLIDRDGDGNFATGTVDVIDAAAYTPGTSVTFNNVSLLNGDVFTVATKLPEAKLTGKVFLQGPYNTTSSNMNTTLNVLDIIPLTDPYGLSVTALTDPNTIANIVDWVKIEIRDATTPNIVIKSVAAFVRNDGVLLAIDGSSTTVNLGTIPGNYYIAIRHRNHLGVMTNTALDFTGATVTANVDFTVTSPAHGVYGTHARKEVQTGVWAMWAGNVNNDGKIVDQGTFSDAIAIADAVKNHVGNTSMSGSYIGFSNVYSVFDINLDGKVYDLPKPSDKALIRSNVMTHPGNVSYLLTYFIMEQLP